MDITPYISDVADFPKKGVVFKDISPLLREKFPELTEHLHTLMPSPEDIDVVIGIESRGFILGAALAARAGKGFVPVRKKGKLPPPVLSESYSLEYGEDTLEIKSAPTRPRPLRAVLVDDVLATGGTLRAALALCERAGYGVTETLVLMDLRFLNTMAKDGFALRSLLTFN